MTFAFIDAKKADFPIGPLCRMLGVSPSGYYAWQRRASSRRQRTDFLALAHVRASFTASRRTYGSRRIQVDLREQGVPPRPWTDRPLDVRE